MLKRGACVFGLGETNLGVDEEVEIKGYNWISGRGTSQKVGGVGIWVKQGVIARKENTKGEGWVAIKVKQGKKWRGVIFCYCWQAAKVSLSAEKENLRIREEMGEQIRKWKSEGVKGWIVLGDFNARLGWLVGDRMGSRNKPGRVVDNWVRSLDMKIWNGLDGVEGRWTFMSGKRKSVVDYVITGGMEDEEIDHVFIDDDGGNGIDSDHSPIWIDVKGKVVERNLEENRNIKWESVTDEEWNEVRMKTTRWWDDRREGRKEAGLDYWQFFKQGLREGVKDLSVKMNKKIRRIVEKGSVAVREAKKVVNSCKKEWAKALKNKERVGEKLVGDLYIRLYEARVSLNDIKLCEKGKHKEKVRREVLEDLKFGGSKFWAYRRGRRKGGGRKVLKKSGGGIAVTEEEIRVELIKHWKKLDENEGRVHYDEVEEDEEMVERGDRLGGVVNQMDVDRVIQEARNGKAMGEDKIANEQIKYGGEVVGKEMVKLFNEIREREESPVEWREGETVLLEKKGDLELLDNYRGITLQSCVGKMYAKIFGKRIYDDAEEREIFGDFQFAFREGFSAMEAAYILGEIVEQGKKGEDGCYLAFIDIRKAYDRVNRDILWNRLREEGYGGKVLRIIQDLYRENKGCFRFEGIKTEMMDRTRGVRQGCVLSPLLFSLYINGVIKEMQNSGMGAMVGGERIPLLVFADDIVICARSREELRKMMGILIKGLDDLELEISETKSMVMKCGEKQIWMEEDESEDDEDWGENIVFVDRKVIRISTGTDYKYLGVMVSNLGVWCAAGREGDDVVLDKFRKTVGLIRSEAGDSFDRVYVGSKLWEAVGIPAVLYGGEVAEVGLGCMEELEKKQVELGKWVLGVKGGVPDKVVLWELGWLPLKERVLIMRERFMRRLENMDESRLAKRVMIGRRDQGWCKRTKKLLGELNALGDEGLFKQKVIGGVMDKWREDMDKTSRVEGLEGRIHWKVVYRHREVWGLDGWSSSSSNENLWRRARTNNWEEWEGWEGMNDRACKRCGRGYSGIKHVVMDCVGWVDERNNLGVKLRSIWGDDVWDDWVQSEWDVKLAMVLGLTGGCGKQHRKAVEEFLVIVKGFEDNMEGKRNMGCARTRGVRGWEGW